MENVKETSLKNEQTKSRISVFNIIALAMVVEFLVFGVLDIILLTSIPEIFAVDTAIINIVSLVANYVVLFVLNMVAMISAKNAKSRTIGLIGFGVALLALGVLLPNVVLYCMI